MLDKERPSDVKNLKVSSNPIPNATLTWSEAVDNGSVEGYKIYVNGTLLDVTKNIKYELTGLEYGKSYTVIVIAFDEFGNTSLNPVLLEINENEKPVEVDKGELNKLIAESESLKEEDYTAESWKNFTDKLAEAKAILSKEDAGQEEVNSIKSSLEKAIEDLEKVDGEKPVEVNKAELKKSIAIAEGLK
ncbi:hypothetical protein GNF83_17070, partial [Clostridium perfringens]|nr:hypothetical protein [Clostridium perfringens]